MRGFQSLQIWQFEKKCLKHHFPKTVTPLMSLKEATWVLLEPQEVWRLFQSSSMESKAAFTKVDVITFRLSRDVGDVNSQEDSLTFHCSRQDLEP